MNVKEMIEYLQDLPEDYEMNFSKYTSIVVSEDSTSEEYFVVIDDPIVGVIFNNDTKEVRFFTSTSEERVIKEIEDGKEWETL